ncbi:hypothetical protein GA0061100_11836 [Rhizobium hainanense]|uniref:Uncharacterized protein n=1 Tax=Rhizobium hainanense TaxID=52131 RepID=A0A1C3WH24_9HYPH|nr:hypothetical protein GA0061100_11836 [Rhizobium hainanense]
MDGLIVLSCNEPSADTDAVRRYKWKLDDTNDKRPSSSPQVIASVDSKPSR